jgi:hypothetical protein
MWAQKLGEFESIVSPPPDPGIQKDNGFEPQILRAIETGHF